MMNAKIKVFTIGFSLFLFIWSCWGLSAEYYPNYKINDQWENVLQDLIKVKAYKQTWNDVPEELFSNLNSNFKQIFNYFPQNPEYKVVYDQCLITTNVLRKDYDYDDFLTFNDRCFEPLNGIIKEVNKNFTVNAKINATPKSGSAPLTVTFDGKSSSDPSDDTIPSKNYFWYFKDNDWIDRAIWVWPVVNYTFTQAWTYIIHLTVRSVNWEQDGIWDWTDSISVSVDPKAANLSVYVNSKQLRDDYYVKVGTQQSKSWIVIDGSWTNPLWWRKIISHKWTIKGSNWFSYTKNWDWNPGSFRLKLSWEWEYDITLAIQDNEWNEISQTYKLIVSDPIATIKFSPEKWTTSTKYNFDPSLSYSIESKIKTYKWIVYDPNGVQLDSFEWKWFQRQFKTPWTYTVKLTVVDELWNISDDQVKFYVESTPPVAQFISRPVDKWKNPSQFVFDAWASYDYDQLNWWDEIGYERWFSNDSNINIEKSVDNNRQIIVSFNQVWIYAVNLTITDKWWKITNIEKEIEIKSTLRPEITANPRASVWWSATNFSVTANKTISYYEWDFGDGKSAQTRNASISHVYENAWAYLVKLKVISPSWEENEVYYSAFVWQKWYPIVWYSIDKGSSVSLNPTEYCSVQEDWKTNDYSAYSVERYDNIQINWWLSVNAQWTQDSLKVYYKPQNDEIYNKTQITYKFSELGCQYIDMSVEDQQINKLSKSRIRFKVKNATPTLNTLELSFPQYWNEIWIWLNQKNTNNQDIFNVEYDPLIVKVSATWVKDSDWYVSHFVWYYYAKEDPTRLLEVKITPANVPYAIFALSRIPWEFAFGVKIVDNEWMEQKSEEIIWQWPTVFFPANSKNPDIPIVTLKVNNINAKVWDEVEFDVVAKILSSKEDFNKERVIKYDFDWDWTYDMITKKSNITHVYSQPWTYKPKVKVIYRWYAGIWYWDTIEVKKWLKAWFLYDIYWTKVIMRNISFWDISSKEFCMDLKYCKTDSESTDKFAIGDKDYFDFDYKEFGKKILRLIVQDEYWNQESSNSVLEIKEFTWDIQTWTILMSVPNASLITWWYEIQVWNILNNSILYYIISDSQDCYMDFDITTDEDEDWNPEWDRGLECNTLKMQEYKPTTSNIISRIYYISWDEVITKDVNVNFLDVDFTLSDELQQVYENISDILNSFPQTEDKDVLYLKTLLANLRGSLWDSIETDSLIIQIYDWIDVNSWLIESNLQTQVEDILLSLSDKSVSAAIGWTQYDMSKANILIFMPQAVKQSVQDIFSNIEENSWNQDSIKAYLQQILDIAKWEVDNWNLDETDLSIITTDVCSIMDYYEIQSSLCGNLSDNTQVVEEDSGSSWWFLSVIIKIIIIVFVVLLVWFIGLTLIFAVKAKKQREQQASGSAEKKEETKLQNNSIPTAVPQNTSPSLEPNNTQDNNYDENSSPKIDKIE